ncbi:hypothetical protein [Caballeronia sp. ATUFL_F1_KS39]|uniref:hypothetical protein n=1 Tax=Caballeronia sp. ATUFL_F1_KS39 TaxID=2921766 RepID=UPI00202878E8|nr:hypothetical protein [Caballeronia sp. ATUFL_F1_KS39]
MAIGQWLHRLLGYPSVSAIQIASLRPGDLLVVKLPDHTTPEVVLQIRDLLEQRIPKTVNCAVMVGEEIRFEVVRVVNPANRPFQRPIGGFAAGCSTTGLTVVLEQ